MKKPRDMPTMSEKDVKAMADFFDKCGKLPIPSQERIQQRMHELRDLGLEDIPAYKGTSSSMRQYAWTTLGCEMTIEAGTTLDEEVIFMTVDQAMLKIADVLKSKYNVKPVHAYKQLAKMARDNGDEEAAKQFDALMSKL